MVNLVLFGPPGSGKGTQAVKLAERFGLIHLSTGDLFRFNIKNETQLGVTAKSYIDKGSLVPDEITTDMVADFLTKNKEAKGFIFDGYPRTTGQAEALDELLEKILDTSIKVTLALTVEDEKLKKRLLERGLTSGRSDDADITVIESRIAEYYSKTEPVSTYYKNQRKWIEVNGVGEISTITDTLSSEINLVL